MALDVKNPRRVDQYLPLVDEQELSVDGVTRHELDGAEPESSGRRGWCHQGRLDPSDGHEAGQVAGLAVGLRLLLLQTDLGRCPRLQVARALYHAVLPIYSTHNKINQLLQYTYSFMNN